MSEEKTNPKITAIIVAIKNWHKEEIKINLKYKKNGKEYSSIHSLLNDMMVDDTMFYSKFINEEIDNPEIQFMIEVPFPSINTNDLGSFETESSKNYSCTYRKGHIFEDDDVGYNHAKDMFDTIYYSYGMRKEDVRFIYRNPKSNEKSYSVYCMYDLAVTFYISN